MNLYFNSGYVPDSNRLNAFEATAGGLVDAVSGGSECWPLTLEAPTYFTPTFSAVFNHVSEPLENPRSTGGAWVDLQYLHDYKAALQCRIQDLSSSISWVAQSAQNLQDTESSNQLTWQSVDTLIQSIADDLGVVDSHALWQISRLFAVDVYTGYCALVAELDRALNDFRNYLDNQIHRVDEITASVLRMMPANRSLRSVTKLQRRWYQRHVSHPSDTLCLAADGCL
ncbi:MAG TPA: hypothetical protein VFI95_16410 [Terriglobales bacterium]|nr:hypothetical protein [Terriglobales bacterium]